MTQNYKHSLFIATSLLLLTIWIPNYSFADNINLSENSLDKRELKVTGKITDEDGSPLPGVNILEKGTSNGTMSDVNGNFNLVVNSGESVLVFSFIGLLTQEVRVGSQTNFTIKMMNNVATLSEIVVVGYGTQEKRDITGSVTSIKSEDFNRGIINSPEQLLQGKAAGVNVTSASGEPGANQNISIRGPGGIRTGSTPLFVVDGFALDNASTGGATNPLNFINPQDIESIDVLKDASATAIYGARGANGVILITTKKGKAGQSSLNYSVDYGVSNLSKPLDVFSADEFRKQVVAIGGVLEDFGGNTDWQKEVTRTAVTKNHNLTFGGGADKLTYYASLGMQDQDGILKESNMKRYSGRLNVTQRFLDDKLRVDLNMSAAQTINTRPPINSMIAGAISGNPTIPAYDSEGKPTRYEAGVNPLRSLELSQDITTINRVLGNISPSYNITKDLVYKMNFGVDYSNAVRDIQSMPSLVPQQDGRLENIYTNNSNRLVEHYLTYTKVSGIHNFSAMAGYSYQKIFVQERASSIDRFPISPIEPRFNPGLGQNLSLALNRPRGFAFINELQSFFGRVNYQLKDRYLFTATVRADGSSKFGANNKYGTFPSFSTGWRISEEAFMQSVPAITDLKLRAGWGLTGNQEIPPKITQPLFTSQVSATTSYPLNPTGPFPAGFTYARLANPDIQWEVSTQTNVGLDFGLFKGALSGSVDYFRKVSNNILLEVIPADPVQPASTLWTNVEDMTITNSGLELALNYSYKSLTGISFNIGGNVTFINNIVENSPYSVIPSGSASGSGLSTATINGYINGYPIGTFFIPEHIGFNELGNSKFRDLDGNGVINEKDRVAAGSALPTRMFNFFGSLSYKGFDFAANFNGVSGNKIYDNTANANFYKLRLSKSLNSTPEAIEFPQESINNAASVSTRFLKDGAFLRMNNASIGYNLSPSTIGLKKWIQGVRVSVTGQNLFVITKYDGFDPEVNTDRTMNGVTSYGIDYLSYPKARTFLMGLNITL
jgi:TonB-dependent starch-binding outer membrane protein SusC